MRDLRGPAVLAAVVALVVATAGTAGAADVTAKTSAWKRVATNGFKEAPDFVTATGGGGFVAIEDLPSAQFSPVGAAVYTSSDGRRWRAAPSGSLEFGPQAGVSALSWGSKGLIVSGEDGPDGQEQVAFWRSRDGRNWTQVDTDPAVFGAPGATVGVNGVIQGPKGYVAVGFEIDGDGALNAAVWTSGNGTDWTQAPATGALDEAVSGENAFVMNDVTYARKTYVAVGLYRSVNAAGKLDEEPAIWTSRDARRWTRRTNGAESPAGFSADSEGAQQVRLDLVVPTDGGFAATGNQEHSERDYTMGGFTLYSPDGVRWRPARADGRPFAFAPKTATETAVRYAAAADGTAVISGILRRANDQGSTAKIWVSDDGRDWKSVKGKLVDGYVEGPVGMHDDGAVVLGYPHNSDRSPVVAWITGKP
jgi:hypothetical protein